MSELNGNQVAVIEPIGEAQPVSTMPTKSASQDLADTVLDLINEHAAGQADKEFWEILRDVCISKVGHPVRHVEGMKSMDAAGAKKFLDSLMPCGKYMDTKISTILKKDKEYLIQFSKQPSAFQIRLRRFLLYLAETK